MLFVASCLLLSCTTNTTTNVQILQNVVPESETDPDEQLITARSFAGTWNGTYTCAQGLTGLTLDIDRASPATVTAVFQFHAIADNPDLPSGSFIMHGVVGKDERLTLHAVEWISRPDHWVTVDLAGTLSADGQQFTGKILGPGTSCTSFSLQRQYRI